MDRADSAWACYAKMVRVDAWRVRWEHVGCGVCAKIEFGPGPRAAELAAITFDTEAEAWNYIYCMDLHLWYVRLPCAVWTPTYPLNWVDEYLHFALNSHAMHDSIMYICAAGGAQTAKIWVENIGKLRAVVVDDRRPARPHPCVADAPAPLER